MTMMTPERFVELLQGLPPDLARSLVEAEKERLCRPVLRIIGKPKRKRPGKRRRR